MKHIIKFLTSSAFKRLLWITAEGFLSLVIVYVADLNLAWTPIITAILANIVKYINTNYLQVTEALKKVL